MTTRGEEHEMTIMAHKFLKAMLLLGNHNGCIIYNVYTCKCIQLVKYNVIAVNRKLEVIDLLLKLFALWCA